MKPSYFTPSLFSSQGSHRFTPGSGPTASSKTPIALAYLENTLNALPLGVFPILIVQQPMWVADELHEALGLGATQHWVLQVIAVLTQRFKATFSYPFLRKPRIGGLGQPVSRLGIRGMDWGVGEGHDVWQGGGAIMVGNRTILYSGV